MGTAGSALGYLIVLMIGFAWIMHSPDGAIERSISNRIKKLGRRLAK